MCSEIMFAPGKLCLVIMPKELYYVQVITFFEAFVVREKQKKKFCPFW